MSTVSYFISCVHPDLSMRLSVHDRTYLAKLLSRIPGLLRAHLLTPAAARDRYIDDGPAPLLTLQLYFKCMAALEVAVSVGGGLWPLAAAPPPFLSGTRISKQAMLTRCCPVAQPQEGRFRSRPVCSFLVHYPGEALDLNGWLTHYLSNHVPLMCRLPDVRAVEVYTRVDWIDALPWSRANHFQRNKLVFDSAGALECALHSPVRDEMKADRARFPTFWGGSVHHALSTETVEPTD